MIEASGVGTLVVQAFDFGGERESSPAHIGLVLPSGILPYVYQDHPLPMSKEDALSTHERGAKLTLGYQLDAGPVPIGDIEITGLPAREGCTVQLTLGMTLEMDGRLELRAHVRHVLDADLQIVDPQLQGQALDLELTLPEGSTRL